MPRLAHMSTPTHWDAAYAAGDTTRGWYQSSAHMSLRLMREHGVQVSAAIVDIGAGASVFVDDLLDAGFSDITCVDHSPVGLEVARQRLGIAADGVTWVVADLREWQPAHTYDVWHDRAVLHFLLTPAEVADYRQCLLAATVTGSLVIIGVFGPGGPSMCAGLPVQRYDPTTMTELLGEDFDVLSHEVLDHVRPDGDTQEYLWTVARRR